MIEYRCMIMQGRRSKWRIWASKYRMHWFEKQVGQGNSAFMRFMEKASFLMTGLPLRRHAVASGPRIRSRFDCSAFIMPVAAGTLDRDLVRYRFAAKYTNENHDFHIALHDQLASSPE